MTNTMASDKCRSRGWRLAGKTALGVAMVYVAATLGSMLGGVSGVAGAIAAGVLSIACAVTLALTTFRFEPPWIRVGLVVLAIILTYTTAGVLLADSTLTLNP